jgi:ADP-heptose:LPS heptosyltransferase
MNSSNSYKPDCKFFRGDIPCKPHKETGVHCDDCQSYNPKKDIILIIKLGAIGDVIRTTPLLHKIWSEYPNSSVWWLTNTLEIVPEAVNKVFAFSQESILILQATEFSRIINLDKDPHACALTKLLNSQNKFGFTQKDGKPSPVNKLSEQKFLTGIFDDVNKLNTKNYLQEIFEICGWNFSGEEYILDLEDSYNWDIPSGGQSVIGLNTGCGARWTSRLWKDEYWLGLIKKLQNNGFYPLILGGEQEHEKNQRLSVISGASYLGYYPLQQFISLMNCCDLVVTAVTMGLHIAIGLKKQVILMNNIFNRNEFELYGRGEIVEPDKECTCFFSPKCKNPEYFCMDYLSVDKIYNAILRNIPGR